jgi:lipopolysaccharide export system protein LptA
MRLWYFLLLTAFVAVLASPVTAEKIPTGNQPIIVKSNELATDSNNKTATFNGKVTARQGDVTIYSDTLIVTYSGDGGGVETIEAIGNVRIVQGNHLGYAGRALYNNGDGKITMTENPRVYQGKDFVSGKVITYYVADGRSEVEGGGGGQVEAIIHPSGKRDHGGAKR